MPQRATSRRFPTRRANLFGWSKKEKTAKRKKHSAASTDARGAGFRYGKGTSDENFSEWLDRKDLGDEKTAVKEKLGLAFSAGYDRGKAQIAGKERIQRKREEFAEKKLQKQIEALDKKIQQAEKKIDVADKKVSGGALTESEFERIRKRMQEEIQKQEEHKRSLASRNPTFGYGVYRTSFMGEDQLAHFSSKPAAETWARTHGVTDYKIKRAFKKNPSCASTRKETVSDRAKRYRANQRGCKPAGVKKCKLCGSKSDLMIDHVDGDESNGRKSNLRWLCRSCNTTLGAEMAKTGQGRRTVQYNPASGGAQTLGEYMQAVLQHTRGAHDEGGKIIHATPKARRKKFASEIWRTRSARAGSGAPDWVTNPAVSAAQYRLAQAVLASTARESAMPREVAQEIVERTPARLRSEYMMGSAGGSENPRKPEDPIQYRGVTITPVGPTWTRYDATMPASGERLRFTNIAQAKEFIARELGGSGHRSSARGSSLRNPEQQSDGSEEYEQALRTAELFHGRPVKEEIEVKESIRTHDWYVSIGPLVKLVIKPITKKPKRKVPLPFHQSEAGIVQLFCSPDGRQFYLRGGDQELDLDAFGMGENTRWYRDHMLIGEAVEITYRDRKKFHSFKLTDYFHKLGEETGVKPTLAYNTLSKKLEIIGGQYHVEMDDLVDDMSPGIVN